ncbi:MAG: hypothetical protein QM270_10415 [Bacillota bacterium]|nr:hypothetical protein [Bacillota bacterium]
MSRLILPEDQWPRGPLAAPDVPGGGAPPPAAGAPDAGAPDAGPAAWNVSQSATSTVKCPNCGAGIAYQPDVGAYRCDFCRSSFTTAEMNELTAKRNLSQQRHEDIASRPAGSGVDQAHIHGYNCQSCGAQVVTTDTTTATFCYYCHNPVIITGRLHGDFLPDQMIPFRISREQAEESFKKWTGSKRLLPDDFTSASTLEKLTGLYLPYWYTNAHCDIKYQGTSVSSRTWTSGDIEYTETTTRRHVRYGDVELRDVGMVAFSKFDEDLLNGISPYSMDDAEAFQMPLLSGYLSESFDRSRDDMTEPMNQQAGSHANAVLNQSLSPYIVRDEQRDITVFLGDWLYTLLPTWVLTYNYNKHTYVYAVNGQTGQTYGELPLDRRKLAILSGIIAAVVLVLLLVGGYFIW